MQGGTEEVYAADAVVFAISVSGAPAVPPQ